MRRILGVLSLVLISLCGASTMIGQTGPLAITGGRISINDRRAGEGSFQTSVFSAAASFTDGDTSPWTACYGEGCRLGSTFRVPEQFLFGNAYRGRSFTIGGVTYENAYHSAGELMLNSEPFFVPKISRRKGLLVIRRPFTLAGRLRVCQVMEGPQPCPADKLLFDGQIAGRGTLTVTGRIRTNSLERPRFYIESFEHVFESQ